MAQANGAFDPAVATAAYLSQLPPEVHARATAYTQGGHWLLLWDALVAILVAVIILRSGVLVRLRHWAQGHRKRVWLAVVVVAVAFTLLASLLTLPWDAYAYWWREKGYGLTSQPFVGWLMEELLGAVVNTVTAILMLSGLYFLIRRAPRTWWLWGGAATVVFVMFLMVISPLFIQPLFNTYKPAPPGPVRDLVVSMAKANGVPSDKIFIYDGSKQSNRYTANVSGLLGTARIAMSDVMFQKGADLAELRGVVGHEMGHYARGHIPLMALVYGLIAVVGLFLVDRLFSPVARLAGAEGVEGLADPAGYPVITIVVAVLALLATPLTNSINRMAETDADKFSLERANEPDGFARALVKTVEYRAATPSKLEELIFYSHPSVGGRIRRAMEWKAAHPKNPG